MSVNGISGAPSGLILPREVMTPRVEQERSAHVAVPVETPATRVSGTGLLAPRQQALPVEAPPGTDPALWEVLTTEERSYFAKMQMLGPLTYGRPSNAAPASETPMGRGGRLDVKA
jgi:hypothetical protein